MNKFNRSAYVSLAAIAVITLAPSGAFSEELPARGPIPFAAYDRDGNGLISEQEFTQVRSERMAAKAEQGRAMKGIAGAPSFSAFDTDKDGQLTAAELTAGQQQQMQKRRGAGGKGPGMGPGMGRGSGKGPGMGMGMAGNRPGFADFDLNGDGAILEAEFNDARAARIQERAEQGYPMRNIGNAPAFSEIDANGDGKLDAQEFADHQMQRRQQKMQRQ